MITRLMIAAWDFEGSEHTAMLLQSLRHVINKSTTTLDSILPHISRLNVHR